MYYLIYKTINKVNGRYYIGSHKTEDLNDSYLGSGTRLKKAIEKYGAGNFEREILHVFDSSDEMFAKEAELVTEEKVRDPDCYNLKIGGEGGWDHIDYSNLPKSRIDGNRKGALKSNTSEKAKRRATNLGRDHFARIGSLQNKNGSSNPCFGTRWITNGIKTRKIKKNQEIPEGYRLGRK